MSGDAMYPFGDRTATVMALAAIGALKYGVSIDRALRVASVLVLIGDPVRDWPWLIDEFAKQIGAV
jgi:hypothetical protein